MKIIKLTKTTGAVPSSKTLEKPAFQAEMIGDSAIVSTKIDKLIMRKDADQVAPQTIKPKQGSISRLKIVQRTPIRPILKAQIKDSGKDKLSMSTSLGSCPLISIVAQSISK